MMMNASILSNFEDLSQITIASVYSPRPSFRRVNFYNPPPRSKDIEDGARGDDDSVGCSLAVHLYELTLFCIQGGQQ